jgi:signal transduction histidine kinase
MGDDLISDEVVAILELVKNAYDADAHNVLIELVTSPQQSDEKISIIDNGHGMSRDTILNEWMQPATSTKLRRTRSPGGRRVLGEKGIGRFAASRLADELELITRATGSATEIQLLLDWTEFDRREFLDEVTFTWKERVPVDIRPGGTIERVWPEDVPDDEKNHGTILHLNTLRTHWNRQMLSRMRTALSRLVSPFEHDLGFTIKLSLPAEYQDLSGRVEPPASLGHPDYVIRGHVAEDGSYQLTYEHDGRSVTIADLYKLKPEGRKAACGPFDLELRVWDRERPSLERLASSLGKTVRDVQQDLNEATGISIYRDGFRVLPYGEPHNDWMRLDIRRVQNPTLRISNNQVVGSILISADGNPALQDQTNREGLKQGQALTDLETLVLVVLSELEKRRYAERRSPVGSGIVTPAEQQEQKRRDLFGGIDLQPLRSIAQERYAGDKELQHAIEEQDRLIARRLEQVKDVFSRYSRLATMGQLVDVILHDGRTYLAQIGNEVELGRRSTARITQRSSALVSVASSFEKIGQYTASLGQLFRRIEPFSGRARGRFERVAIEQIIAEAIAIFATEIKQLGVEIIPLQTHTELRVIPAEVEQIFVNLVQNSLYWLQQVPAGTRRIECQVRRIGPEEVEVLFCDSGPGVPEEFRDEIFLPYFSGKPDGTGLGLTIAGETAAEYDGHLELVSPGPGACFRLTLRQRSR